MILAHLANHETDEVYPSLAYLEAHTGLSRKTLIACLQELESEDVGVLVRTGEMKGRTGQIPVYRFVQSPLVPLIEKGTGGKFHLSEKPKSTGGNLRGKGGVFTEETVVKTPPGTENKNREEKQDSPPTLRVGTPPTDLLGDPISSSTAIVTVDERGTILEYVDREWARLAADYPRIPRVTVWNDSRKKAVAARANEVVRSRKGSVDAWQVWDEMFAAIRADSFLRGEGNPSPQYPAPFAVHIDYVLRPRRFAEILDKAEVNEHDNRATTDSTGRRFGPGEQAYHDALGILRRNGTL